MTATQQAGDIYCGIMREASNQFALYLKHLREHKSHILQSLHETMVFTFWLMTIYLYVHIERDYIYGRMPVPNLMRCLIGKMTSTCVKTKCSPGMESVPGSC